MISQQSHAETLTPYKITKDGWYIYKEELSCVAYADFGETTIRISDRVDQDKLFFSIVNTNWGVLANDIGKSETMILMFPEIKKGLAAPSMIIRNTDKRYGYIVADFSKEKFISYISSQDKMIIKISDHQEKIISKLILRGSAIGLMNLEQCTDEFFNKD